ncbi:MAG: serine/threonine-protein kinase [Deltaproteobacteria bacterium]|nr:serine/threonine-protein kinase [Deltaproteobacteria bacterium]
MTTLSVVAGICAAATTQTSRGNSRMKICPNCKKTYEDEANFCPEEACATDDGPRRLEMAGGAAKGRFVPQERIGGGRTGEVWRALDSQTGATVALKILDATMMANPVTAGRVDRELRQLMRVDNAHVVRVLDVGKLPDGRVYSANELVSGSETLATVLRRGAMPLQAAKQLLAQIGEGLLEAQKAGLVHRDLAPKNILIDSAGQVKIGNFALAVPVDDKLAGVAEYASPEQAQGKPVDQRSNTYSLACIFYHLITGEPPFAGTDPKAIFELHASSLPLAPSQRRPEASLGPDVDRVVLKALDKNSSKRPLTLRLFLNEVDSLTVAAPAAVAGKTDAGGVGFAKTMLFAGGQAEVQQMVQKAIAQRQAAQGGPAPVAAPAPAPTPPPVVVPTPSPVVMPTPSPVAAAPAPAARVPQAADGSAAQAPRLTPPPVTPNPLEAPQAPVMPIAKPAAAPSAAAATGAAGGKGAAFRETLWFKKGDVEQMVADAKAKVAAAGGAPEKLEAPEDIRPIEDRYVDDGSVSTDDRKKFSLRTGGTATALPTVGKFVPGEKMSEEEMAGELAPGRKMGVIIGVGVAVVIAVLAAVLLMGGKKKEMPAPAAAAPAAAAPAPAAAPPPPAPPPAPPAAAPAAAAAPEPTEPEPKAPVKAKAKAAAKKKLAKSTKR